VQQLREAFPEDRAPRYLILDRDCKFSGEVATMLKDLGSDLVRTAYRSPWQNDVAERWVGSCRRELSPRAYGPRNLMKVAGVATKWKRNVAATQVLNPLLSVALSRLSTLLDHVIVLNEFHLRRLVRDYLEYYHEDRIHDALKKEAPTLRTKAERDRQGRGNALRWRPASLSLGQAA
jgi:transposase InsO family protein